MEEIFQTQERDVNIVILGLENTGKTNIVNSLLEEDITPITTTYGVNQDVIKLKGLNIGLTDLGGGEPFRKTLWKNYVERADGVIYVVDGTNINQLGKAKHWFKNVCYWTKESSAILVLINTWDKKGYKNEVKAISYEFKKIANKCKKFTSFHCFEASPISKKKLNKAMNWLATTIIKNIVKEHINIESFVAQVKIDENALLEAKILMNDNYITDLLLSSIRNRFAEEGNTLLEYMQYKDCQILFAADSSTSCAILTKQNYSFKSANLILQLLSDFIKEVQGWVDKKEKRMKETELTKFIMKNIIDKQDFWKITGRPIFEITRTKQEHL